MALAQNQLTPAQFDYSKAAGGALVGLVAEDGTLIDSGAFVQSDTLGTHSVTIKVDAAITQHITDYHTTP